MKAQKTAATNRAATELRETHADTCVPAATPHAFRAADTRDRRRAAPWRLDGARTAVGAAFPPRSGGGTARRAPGAATSATFVCVHACAHFACVHPLLRLCAPCGCARLPSGMWASNTDHFANDKEHEKFQRFLLCDLEHGGAPFSLSVRFLCSAHVAFTTRCWLTHTPTHATHL
jgi:hypothetical protein